MKALVATFFRGLSVILPIALTIWVVAWLAMGTERLLRNVLMWFLPQDIYVPGLGVALGIAFIFVAGLLAQVFLLRRIWDWMESLFARIPGVKLIFNAIRDFVEFFSGSDIDEETARVVTIDTGNDLRLVGLLTDNNPPFQLGEGSDLIAVYLPMSYNVGGYTVLVPRSRIQDSDLSVEEAMRYALTAGIQKR